MTQYRLAHGVPTLPPRSHTSRALADGTAAGFAARTSSSRAPPLLLLPPAAAATPSHSCVRNRNLNMMEDQLERCQKALADFLEEKRSMMPRFYFIGDDDLLEILGQAKNPIVIQSHLKKLFQAIHSVKFSEDASEIVAMRSVHGEEVTLEQPVKVTDNVEVWLKDLSNEMKRTLKPVDDVCFSMVRRCHASKKPSICSFDTLRIDSVSAYNANSPLTD